MKTTESGPPIGETEVDAFEKKYNISLPPAYRRFLIETNGGRPERDAFSVPGFTESSIQVFLGLNDPITSCNLDWCREVYSDRLPEHIMPIATTGLADIVCMSIGQDTAGAVYYWDGVHISPTYGELYLVANSFEEFLERLYRDDDSPKLT